MNQTVVEILTEETSMEIFLRGLLPRILPQDYQLDVNCFIRAHEGKSHLVGSLTGKFRAYGNYGYPLKVLVLHDQDSSDCLELKNSILQRVTPQPVSMVRIVCRELENWYLGDPSSLCQVYPEIHQHLGNRIFKDPDRVFGYYEVSRLTRKFTKTHAARQMGHIIQIGQNSSHSFNQFVSGLNTLISK